MTHPVILLSLITLVAVLGVAIWSFASVKRRESTGGKTAGLGGPNDPMA